MIPVAAALLGYAVLLAWAVPVTLARATWPSRAPRAAVLLWLAASAAASLSFAAGLTLATLPLHPVWRLLGALLHSCLRLIDAAYCPTALPPAAAGLALLAGVALAARLGLTGARRYRAVARHRRTHRDRLAVFGTDPAGVTVVPHPTPAVYAVPGRRPRIVMTTAAYDGLTIPQRAAALSHERAHLTGHHHVLLGLTGALAAALPIPLFRATRDHTARLIELIADDHAVAHAGRTALASALVCVAAPAAPATIALDGGDTITRVQRLLGPADRPRPLTSAASIAASAMLLAVPALTVTAPLLLAAG